MTWTAPSKKRSRRPVWLTAALLVILMLATPLAAHAGKSSYDDSGPAMKHGTTGAGDKGGKHPNFKCGENIGKRPGVLYHFTSGSWQVHYEGRYPNCLNKFWWDSTGVLDLCVSGFEVYRFYGRKDQPLSAVTRSRLNLTRWCAEEDKYTFAAQTAWDAAPGEMPGSPDFIREDDNFDQAANDLEAMVGRREHGYLTSGRPVKVLGTCTTVSRANPVKDWFTDQTKAEKVTLRQDLGNAYAQLGVITNVSNGGKNVKLKFPDSAAQELGFKSVNGYMYSEPNPKATKKPEPSRNGTNFYAESWRWNDDPCATPFNFTTVTDSDGAVLGGEPLAGTCYIPVVRRARQFVNGGEMKWGFESLTQGYGERYSKHYALNGNKPGDDVPDAWRQAMEDDYKARFDSQGSFYNKAGIQTIPAQHYPGELNTDKLGTPVNERPNKAAEELRKWSKCRMATQVTLSTSTGNPGPEVPATMQLTAHNQRVLQAGGSTFQSTFTVKAGALMCGDTPCGNKATLTDLKYDVELRGTGGFTECVPGQISRCDFRILSYKPGSEDADATLVAEFYQPTSPGQGVDFVVKNVSADYAYVSESVGLVIEGKHPVTGKFYEVRTEPVRHVKSQEFTPTVAGTRRPMSPVGNGEHVARYHVIGAVDIPLG